MIESNLYSKAFGQDLSFMDSFHDYPSRSNIRYYHRLKASIVRDFIRNNAKPGASFLDAGGGTGPYCQIAHSTSSFGKIHLLEFDAIELERGRKNLSGIPNVESEQADLRSVPLPDNSIDVAVCSEVLEHIPNEELAARELFRVMKPGGRILISMPNASSLFYKRVRAKMPSDLLEADMDSLPYSEWEKRRHISFSASNIRNIVKEAGFKIVRTYGANVIPLPTSIRERLERIPALFRAFNAFHSVLARTIPSRGSFYFVEAAKPGAQGKTS